MMALIRLDRAWTSRRNMKEQQEESQQSSWPEDLSLLGHSGCCVNLLNSMSEEALRYAKQSVLSEPFSIPSLAKLMMSSSVFNFGPPIQGWKIRVLLIWLWILICSITMQACSNSSIHVLLRLGKI